MTAPVAPVAPVAVKSRLQLLIVLGALAAFAPVASDLYLPGFPQIAQSLNVETGAVQLTFSACLIGLAVGQIFYGPLSDRFGRRPPMLFGLAVFTLASIGCAFAPSLEVLIVLRFVQALGGCAGMVIPGAMVRDLYSGVELARTLSAVMMVFALGPVLAPALGGLIMFFATWPWLFIALAIYGVLCIIGILSLPETLPQQRRSSHGVAGALRNLRSVGRDRRFWLPSSIMVFNTVLLFSYISSGPAVFVDSFGLTSTMFGLVFGINSLFIVVGARLNMHLLKRYRPHTLIRAFLTLSVISSAFVFAFSFIGVPVVIFMIPLILATACVQAVRANATAELLHPFPDKAGAASSLTGLLQMGTGAIIAAVLGAGAWSPEVGMGTGMLIGAVIALLLAMRTPFDPGRDN